MNLHAETTQDHVKMAGCNDLQEKPASHRAGSQWDDIVTVVDGIALRATLLALKAVVEDRGGKQAGGIAVAVAGVRNLAQRSAGAAREIRELIGEPDVDVRAAWGAVGQAGRAMADVLDSVHRLSGIVGAIRSASRLQAQRIAALDHDCRPTDGDTGEYAAMMRDAVEAADALAREADRLTETIAVFLHDNTARTRHPALLAS